MGSRVGDYVAILNEAENGDRPLVDVFIDLFTALDGRITSIEAVSQSVAVLQQKLLDSGNAIVSTTLDPLVAELKRKADLGLLLTATSVTEVEIGTGVKTFVVAPDEARASFAPSHILCVVSTDSPSNAMYGRRVSYDPATGSLVVEILSTIGAGTISSWTISPGSLAPMASTVTSAAIGEIAGPTVQAAIGQIAAALAARQGSHANLSALAGLALAAERMLVTTPDGGLDQSAITTAARTFLALGSTDAMRSALGAAPLLSPAFTGAPTVPTPSIAADSNLVVNVTALRQAVAALVASSPAALDTLDELAAALGDDANFAATVTNALAGKQPLDATLTALAALVTAADKLIYATGADTFATTDFLATGRSLAGASTPTDAKTVLELQELKSYGSTFKNLGLGAASAAIKWRLNGTIDAPATSSYGVNNTATVPAEATNAYLGYSSAPVTSTGNTHTVIRHFQAANFSGAANVTAQIGFHAHSGMVGGAGNYGFYGDLPEDGTKNYNCRMMGTAPNYFGGQIQAYGGQYVPSGVYSMFGAWSAPAMIGGSSPPLQSITASGAQAVFMRAAGDTAGAYLRLAKTRSTTNGIYATVVAADQVGVITFNADDGTSLTSQAAAIIAVVDATPSTGVVPGRLSFFTTNSSGGSVERVRLNSSGDFQMGGANTVISSERHIQLRSYTVATLPSATTAGQMIYVSNGTSNKRLAVSDGTNWRWPDGAIVS